MATAGMHNLNNTPADPRPLTAADLERWRGMHRVTFPACTGPCEQGRKLCPCPDACQNDDDDLSCASGIVRALMWCLGLYAVGIAFWLALT